MIFDLPSPGAFRTAPLRLAPLWLALGVVMIAAVVAASLVAIPATSAFVLHDKLVHLCVYAGLTGWFAQIYRGDGARLLLVLAFCALGVGVECLQGLTPGRQFDVVDMLANASGAVLAWALSYTRLGNVLVGVERLFGARVQVRSG